MLSMRAGDSSAASSTSSSQQQQQRQMGARGSTSAGEGTDRSSPMPSWSGSAVVTSQPSSSNNHISSKNAPSTSAYPYSINNRSASLPTSTAASTILLKKALANRIGGGALGGGGPSSVLPRNAKRGESPLSLAKASPYGRVDSIPNGSNGINGSRTLLLQEQEEEGVMELGDNSKRFRLTSATGNVNGDEHQHQQQQQLGDGEMSSSLLINPAWYRDAEGRTGFRTEEWSSAPNLQRTEIKELPNGRQMNDGRPTSPSSPSLPPTMRTAPLYHQHVLEGILSPTHHHNAGRDDPFRRVSLDRNGHSHPHPQPSVLNREGSELSRASHKSVTFADEVQVNEIEIGVDGLPVMKAGARQQLVSGRGGGGGSGRVLRWSDEEEEVELEEEGDEAWDNVPRSTRREEEDPYNRVEGIARPLDLYTPKDFPDHDDYRRMRNSIQQQQQQDNLLLSANSPEMAEHIPMEWQSQASRGAERAQFLLGGGASQCTALDEGSPTHHHHHLVEARRKLEASGGGVRSPPITESHPPAPLGGLGSPPPMPRHGGQIVRSASGYLDTRIALHALPRSGSENSPQAMPQQFVVVEGGPTSSAFLTSFYDNVSPVMGSKDGSDGRRAGVFGNGSSASASGRGIPSLGSPEEEEGEEGVAMDNSPTTPSSRIPVAETESKIKAKFLAKYGGGFLKRAHGQRSPTKDSSAAPKDPAPSNAPYATFSTLPRQGEYGSGWKGAERKISLESESNVSTDSRESVISAASMRAENKVRRYFNY